MTCPELQHLVISCSYPEGFGFARVGSKPILVAFSLRVRVCMGARGLVFCIWLAAFISVTENLCKHTRTGLAPFGEAQTPTGKGNSQAGEWSGHWEKEIQNNCQSCTDFAKSSQLESFGNSGTFEKEICLDDDLDVWQLPVAEQFESGSLPRMQEVLEHCMVPVSEKESKQKQTQEGEGTQDTRTFGNKR